MQTQTTKHAQVSLADIEVSSTNKIFRDESDFTQAALQELMNSIMEHGQIQPITVRPGKKPGKYLLVAGERRFRAAKFIQMANKDRDTIDATVRELTDEQAFDIQLTENIQRKDVHPMREAKAYQFLQETKKWTTAELAQRFGKGETYVLQRLRLTTLIPEAEKDFNNNAMTLGHAILIARLTEEDQKAVVKRCSNKHGDQKYYESIHELEEFIQDNIVRDLKEAGFDLNDPKLLPKAGACVTCPKRSGFNTLLFADVKEKDRCHDGACFNMKRGIAIFAKVKELVEKEPDTIFLIDYYSNGRGDSKVPQQITSFLAGEKIKPINNREHFETYNYGSKQKKITGFWLNGDKAGRTSQVYVAGPATKEKSAGGSTDNGAMSAADKKEAVERIQVRTKRAAELDQEKIYVQIIDGLQKSKSMKSATALKVLPIDKVLSRWIILQHAGYDKAYIPGYNFRGSAEEQIKAIEKISDKDFIQITRKIMLKEYSGQAPEVHKAGGQILWKLADALNEVPVSDFVKVQKEIATKREARAKERIAELTPKKSKKAKAKK